MVRSRDPLEKGISVEESVVGMEVGSVSVVQLHAWAICVALALNGMS